MLLPKYHFHLFNSHHLQLLYRICDFKFSFDLNCLVIKNINLRLIFRLLKEVQLEISIFCKLQITSIIPKYCLFTFTLKIFYLSLWNSLSTYQYLQVCLTHTFYSFLYLLTLIFLLIHLLFHILNRFLFISFQKHKLNYHKNQYSLW